MEAVEISGSELLSNWFGVQVPGRSPRKTGASTQMILFLFGCSSWVKYAHIDNSCRRCSRWHLDDASAYTRADGDAKRNNSFRPKHRFSLRGSSLNGLQKSAKRIDLAIDPEDQFFCAFQGGFGGRMFLVPINAGRKIFRAYRNMRRRSE